MIVGSALLADRQDRARASRRAWLPVTCLDQCEPGAGKLMEGVMAVVDGIRATAVVRAAMAEAGLGRPSKAPGAEAAGWTTSRGASGFSIRRDREPDLINWSVVVSGTPHLRYCKWVEDGLPLREPTNPQVLDSRIRGVFESLGLRVYGVRADAAQVRWDSDDVYYTVTTDEPDWLLSHNTECMPAEDGPALASFSDGRKLRDALWLTSPVSGLVGYDDGFGGALLTRESVERLVQTPPMTVSQGGDVVPRGRRTTMRFEDGVLTVSRGAELLIRAE